MHVGYASSLANPSIARRPWRELWEDHLWLFCEAEQLGFDFIGIEEHFFADDAHGPAPLVFAATAVQRTSTIRIGSWASVLPLRHPALLAHEWATLDQLSGGRTFVTVALGYRKHEYAAFGIDPRTRPSRMEEGFALLRRAFAETEVSSNGRHWNVENLDVVPPPVQQPYPIWGAAASIPAAERAARNKAHLALTSSDPAVYEAYARILRERGEDPSDYRVSLPFHLTATVEDPDKVWHRNRHLYVHRYSEVDRYTREYGDDDFNFGSGRPEDDESRYRRNELIGKPDQILKTLDHVRKIIPLTDIVCLGAAPGIAIRTEAAESLRLLAAEVLPVVQAWTPGITVCGAD